MKVACNVLGRHLLLAGNPLLKELKGKRLKLCAGWPGLWGAPAQGAGWSYGSPHLLWGRVLGCRHGKALPILSHTAHNARCLLRRARNSQHVEPLASPQQFPSWTQHKLLNRGLGLGAQTSTLPPTSFTFSTKRQREVIIDSFFVTHIYLQWLSHFYGEGRVQQQ